MKHSNSFREDDSYYDQDEQEIQGIKAELKKLYEQLPILKKEKKLLNQKIGSVEMDIEYYEGKLKRYEDVL